MRPFLASSSTLLPESWTDIVVDGLLQLCGGGIWITKQSNDAHQDDNQSSLIRFCGEEWHQTLRDMARSTISVRKDNHQKACEGGDNVMIIRTVTALYKRYGFHPNNSRCFSSESSSSNAATARIVEMVSDLGVTRTFHSAYELAMTLVPILEESFCHPFSKHGLRVCHKSGFLSLCVATTTNHQHDDRSMMMISCPECPTECRNAKSLWWHLQNGHGLSHEMAMQITHHICTRDATAIVLFSSSSSALTASSKPMNNTDSLKTSSNECQQPLHNQTLVGNASQSMNNNQNGNDNSDDDIFVYSRTKDWSGLLQCLQRLYSLSRIRDVPNKVDHHGSTILHWAAGSSGSLELVRYLVEQIGCDPDRPQQQQQNSNRGRGFAGRTPLHWAARNGHVTIVQYLLETTYFSSSSSSNPNCHNSNRMEAETEDGTTAFAWAAWQHHLPVLQVLVQYGCRVETTNRFGCNAALWAAQGTRNTNDTTSAVLVMEFLERVGCPLDVRNHSGHGILHKAAQRGNNHLCQWWILHKLWGWVRNRKHDSVDGEHHLQSGNETKVKLRGWLRVLDLLGPDNDGCVPSDLAGMEHFEGLAEYLARQEIQLVQSILEKVLDCCNDAHKELDPQPLSSDVLLQLPDWLTEGVRCHMIVSNNTENVDHNKMHWGSWEGVYRMRSVLTQNKFHSISLNKNY